MTANNKDFRVKNGIVAGGNVTAVAFIGDGSQLTGITGVGGGTTTPRRIYFVGDGTTTTFNLGIDVVLPLAPIVYVGGILQDPVTHYNINVPAKTITFTSAIPSGADVVVMAGVNNDIGTPTDHTVTFQKLAPSNFTYSTYTGDGSTLNYTLAQSTQTPEQLFVFVANVPQTPGTSYTVSGTTLSFSSAPPAGSNIVVRYYGTPLPYQTNVDWNATSGSAQILNKPTLFSGSYSELTNKPTLFSGAYADLTNKPTLFSGAYADLSGKPNLFSGYYADLSGKPNLFSGSYTDLTNKPTLSTVSATGSYNDLLDKPSIPSLTGYATETYVNTQVSNLVNAAPSALDTLKELATALGNDANFATTVSTQLGLKANTSSLATVATTGAYADLSGKPTLATVATSGSYNDLLNKPSLSVLSSVDSLQFNTAYAGTTATGQVTWNSTEGTLNVGLNNGVTLQVGQETHFYAKATEAIPNGGLVMFAGAQGDHVLISKSNLSAVGFDDTWIVGVATQAFTANQYGYVTCFGVVHELNTNAWAEGTILYADPSVAGGLTSTKPTAPTHGIQIAAVVRSHATQGSIFVRPTVGSHLESLHNVNITSVANNDFLKYDTTTTTWKNGQLTSSNVTTALGYTPYNATNPNGYITGITSGNVTTALGYTPYNATNPNGYITGITSGNVTTALGYTPYNATNPNGYISSITSSNVTTALGYTPATAAQVQAANDNAVAMAIALG